MTGAPRIAFYTDSAIVGGAEISLGVLLSELDPAFEAVVTGTDRGVVDWLASRRPGSASRILPTVAGKTDGRAFAGNLGAITSLGPRIFHANLAVPSAGQYALAAATLVPGVRTVAVEHLPYPLQGGLQTWLKRFTSRRLAAHVAVGQEAARQVERYAHLSPRSVRVIHNGVPDVVLEPLPRPYAGLTIGAIGRLDRQKGFDLVLRSLVELPDTHLVIVGDGPERGALEQLAAELGVAARTEFQGWRDDARRHLTTFDVFVAPSRFEGFPLVIVEAMLAGLPVVASTVGSVAEAVVEGRTGLLVPPEDPRALARALAALLGDSGRRMSMGAAGRAHAQAFTPSAMARGYERLYNEILA